jgi:hypothetical protein
MVDHGGNMRLISKIISAIASALLLPACIEQVAQQDVVLIPSAENIRMSDSGRIFVSGADVVHEIVGDNSGGYTMRTVLDEDCSYNAGLAQLRDWMFSVCVDLNPVFTDGYVSLASGRLYARSLSDDRVVLVGELTDFSLPNGLDAIVDDDVILIADEDFTRRRGGVARAFVDFTSGVPVLADLQRRWIGAEQNVSAANGVRVIGRDVFLTDIDTVKRVPLSESGEPGTAQVIYQASTVLDDLVPYCGGLLVTDYIRGLLVFTALDGSSAVESPAGFAAPSAILPDAVPLFEPGQMLVTLSVGARVVRVTADAIGLPSCLP